MTVTRMATRLTASLVSGPAHGTLALNIDGSFIYVPAAGYYGQIALPYKNSDGLSQRHGYRQHHVSESASNREQ